MPDALTPLKLKAAATPAAPGSPGLDLDQIQGDVLIGLQKLVERFVFFEIKDVVQFKALLRRRIAHRVTTTRIVQLREFQLQNHKNQGQTTILPNVGVNLGFTKDGIGKLLPAADVQDPSFKNGARSQAAAPERPRGRARQSLDVGTTVPERGRRRRVPDHRRHQNGSR